MYLGMLCCINCLPSPHTPIHKGIHKGGRGPKASPPPLWRRPEAASFMGVVFRVVALSGHIFGTQTISLPG